MKVVFASLVASACAQDAVPWEVYKAFFGKVYNGDDAEDAHKSTFHANMEVIEHQNSLGDGLTFGMNQFTDMTQAEFQEAAGFGWVPAEEHLGSVPILAEHVYQGEALESSIDWEQRGVVTAVKDQGQCGSCWSFSTTGGLEGAWKLATASLTSMSEQHLVDCSTKNVGCQGGNVGVALTFLENTHVCTESSYAYKAIQGTCQSSCSAAIPRGGVTGFSRVGGFFGTTVDDMKSALAHGPVSIALQGNQNAFQHYKSGILKHGCGSQLDHAVLIVGYGTEGGDEYFRIKNSWASTWGDAGYLRISTSNNVCGALNRQAVYPSVSASVAV